MKGREKYKTFLGTVRMTDLVVNVLSKKRETHLSNKWLGKQLVLKIFFNISCSLWKFPQKFPILELCSLAYPHIRICLVFQPRNRLANLFNFTDRIPKALRSCVVYGYTCQCCSTLYVGQTARHLHTRASDHLGVSALTGKKLLNPSPSSILTHLTETGHTALLNDFKIRFSCSSASELFVRESLIISKLKPSLNTNPSSAPLSLF